MPKYKTSVETHEESILRVTWEDDESNVIVAGEKKVKGNAETAKKLEKVFAGDLRRNFSERFPVAEVTPEEEV
jgi:hypothetical protein